LHGLDISFVALLYAWFRKDISGITHIAACDINTLATSFIVEGLD